jgi:hypothetical protein
LILFEEAPMLCEQPALAAGIPGTAEHLRELLLTAVEDGSL